MSRSIEKIIAYAKLMRSSVHDTAAAMNKAGVPFPVAHRVILAPHKRRSTDPR
jgi:hypothetical protein